MKIGLAVFNEVYKNALTSLFATQNVTVVDLSMLQANAGCSIISDPSINATLIEPELPFFQNIKDEGSSTLTKLITLLDQSHLVNTPEYFKIGLRNFVWKNVDVEILNAIRIVSTGGYYMSPSICRIVHDHFAGNRTSQALNLTCIERIILQSICNGSTSRQIGDLIKKSHRTVEERRERLYKKFEVKSKSELIVKAVAMGLVN